MLGLEKTGRNRSNANKQEKLAKFVPNINLNVDIAKDKLAQTLSELSIADITPPVDANTNEAIDSDDSDTEDETMEQLVSGKLATRSTIAASDSIHNSSHPTPNSEDSKRRTTGPISNWIPGILHVLWWW